MLNLVALSRLQLNKVNIDMFSDSIYLFTICATFLIRYDNSVRKNQSKNCRKVETVFRYIFRKLN